ncbi:TIGR03943 family protein [Phormidium tenue FACHB-886]|nr:TIGR03943 family protein [Phormidium tenue FACHB-886]
MFKSLSFVQELTRLVVGSDQSEDQAAVNIWEYAEPANPEPDPLKRNILQWRRIITGERDPVATFAGQPVEVIGFVHRTANDTPETFTVARQIIRCCMADATPSGLIVYSPRASLYSTGSWLRIRGIFGGRSLHGKPTLVIEPVHIKRIREPKKRFINGVF